MPFEKMHSLHKHIDELILFANQEPLATSPQSTDPEVTAAQALRCMSIVKLNRFVSFLQKEQSPVSNVDPTPKYSARIKLHRYSAFSDIPVFTKRYCDLKQAPSNLDLGFVDDLVQWLTSCACDQTSHIQTSEANNSFSSTSTSTPTPTNHPSTNPPTLPFTKHESSLLCLTSALTIAHAFKSLPYPTPSPPPNQNFSQTHPPPIPRTLPSFACCAMQSAYALLMVCNQAWAMQTTGATILQVDASTHDHSLCGGALGPQPSKLLAQCERGLYSLLGTLENYAVAAEAIGGMRGELFLFSFALLPFGMFASWFF